MRRCLSCCCSCFALCSPAAVTVYLLIFFAVGPAGFPLVFFLLPLLLLPLLLPFLFHCYFPLPAVSYLVASAAVSKLCYCCLPLLQLFLPLQQISFPYHWYFFPYCKYFFTLPVLFLPHASAFFFSLSPALAISSSAAAATCYPRCCYMSPPLPLHLGQWVWYWWQDATWLGCSCTDVAGAWRRAGRGASWAVSFCPAPSLHLFQERRVPRTQPGRRTRLDVTCASCTTSPPA